MRAITQQSSRLCYRVTKRRTRQFSSTTSQLTDSRPQEETKNQNTSATREHGAEAVENGEGKRTGFKRTLRQRKNVEIPPPPPLPKWFMKKSITLRAQVDDVPTQDMHQAIDCVDKETGQVVFHMPSRPKLNVSQIEANAAEQDQKDQPGDLVEASQHEKSTTGRSDSEPSDAQNDEHVNDKHEPEDINKDTSRRKWIEDDIVAATQAEIMARAVFATAGQNISTYAASKSDISLVSFDRRAHERMQKLVGQLAFTLGADLIDINANDIADLTEDYVGQGNDLPGTFSTLSHDVYDGQVAAQVGAPFSIDISSLSGHDESGKNDDRENDEDEEDEEEEEEDPNSIRSIQDFLKSNFGGIEKGLGRVPAIALSFAVPAGTVMGKTTAKRKSTSTSSDSDYVQWDDARLNAILEQIVNAASIHRQNAGEERGSMHGEQSQKIKLKAASAFANLLISNVKAHALSPYSFKLVESKSQKSSRIHSTILHIKDLHTIMKTKLGETLIRRLTKIVQKRRRLGERIIIIGTSIQDIPFTSETEDSFLKITVPRIESTSAETGSNFLSFKDMVAEDSYRPIYHINFRNIGSMIRKLQPNGVYDELFWLGSTQMLTPGINLLVERVLSQSQVHRLVLLALGLTQTYLRAGTIQPIHISVAAAIMTAAGGMSDRLKSLQAIHDTLKGKAGVDLEVGDDVKASASKNKLDKIRANCNPHETRLLSGVVDANNIKTGFKDVHVSPSTIEALKTSTSLALQRPDAFKYGILAADNLSGLMLYGPPGTGKTLLAKAVAKDSKASVLEISGAQIYEKYVGEGEKMVRAVFSLAKKLSPCIVFIDEADAMFGARSASGNRTTHREILNQFLREWDGMDDRRVFVMVATNRPFDVDDAVLRRLPRRLLVDLPTAKDRESILGIHLQGEELDSEVSLANLAEQTALYSGSDLKNVCVAAALAAVQDENALVEQHKDNSDFKLPEKRVLLSKHFEKALRDISASISEDMSSLNAIRKFDEMYGDRGGRKKKIAYGFGSSDVGVDESAARIRKDP